MSFQQFRLFACVILVGFAPRALGTAASLDSETEEQKQSTPPAAQNLRMQAVEGSLSPWSGQFNLTYKGSSLAHPFAEEAPNPGPIVPPPVVTLSGTVAARYRAGPQTTMGFGSGLTTETPLQGPQHTTLADPYVDVAHSFRAAGMRHRLDVQYTQWTNHASHTLYGYQHGLSMLAESLYGFASGLTLGAQVAADANLFARGDYPRSQQTVYGFGVYPSLEYRLLSGVDFRTVFGLREAHNRNLNRPWRYQHPKVYQTVGAGISLGPAFYVYLFIKAYPFSSQGVSAERTLCGFSTVVNLF